MRVAEEASSPHGQEVKEQTIVSHFLVRACPSDQGPSIPYLSRVSTTPYGTKPRTIQGFDTQAFRAFKGQSVRKIQMIKERLEVVPRCHMDGLIKYRTMNVVSIT